MLLPILVVLGAVVLDQLSKYLVLRWLAPIGTYPLWQGVLHFTYVENRGAAFGMLANHRWVFLAASTAAILAIGVYLFRARPSSVLERLSLAMIAGGGIGNMIDRVARGYVVDFIDVACIRFYVFNIADSFVCVGCALMILHLIRAEIRERRAKKEDPS